MSFLASAFPLFLVITLAVYWLAHRHFSLQNTILLVASYVFYGWWDWRFLSLVIASTAIAYGAGLAIAATADNGRRLAILWAGNGVLLGTLFFFKYFNFFVSSANHVLVHAGFPPSGAVIEIILPIGISFYTFQAISYLIDIFRGDAEPELNPINFAVFKAFFPQLVAGPIERSGHLLKQFRQKRIVTPTDIRRALWLLCYGYFLKIGIADVAAPVVNTAFSATQPFGWWTIIGTMLFTIQIYADFNGYSTIAKGIALLFGFDLVWNFRHPYFSASISDFWHRWHISLSSWLRDYLYIPLGGNRVGRLRNYVNLMTTMMLGGLWHGANWTFLAWGTLHGVALCVNRAVGPHCPSGSMWRPAYWLLTLATVMAGWFLFRCQSLADVVGMLSALGNMEWVPAHAAALKLLLVLALQMMALELLEVVRRDRFGVLSLPAWPAAAIMAVMFLIAFATTGTRDEQFIYFQF
jgi:D-alanyl-lipoteichoic acid acyltransferase DltB (MBOAT superfamily)